MREKIVLREYLGKQKILCDLKPTGDIGTDKVIIPKIIEQTRSLHEFNKNLYSIDESYYYNDTNIKFKTKTQQPDINNKISVNYAQIAVTTIDGYCFSEPMTVSSRNADAEVQKRIQALKDAMKNDNYEQKTKQVTQKSGIFSIGYKYITNPTEQDKRNGQFFRTYSTLDPKNTYMVYENSIEQEEICCINSYTKKFYDLSTGRYSNSAVVYTVWTKWHKWEFYKYNGAWKTIPYSTWVENQQIEFDAEPYGSSTGLIPVVPYIRKNDLTNDFELGYPLIDAINTLVSSRIDGVQEVVDYLLVLRDIDTDSDEALEAVKKNLKAGILSFKSIPRAMVQPEVSKLDMTLNQSEVQTLQDFLCKELEEVLNIPSRETRGSSGDTGLAVESRAGYRSLENIAGEVTSNAIYAENKCLELILAIGKGYADCPYRDLELSDIQINSNRNRAENMVNSANAYNVMKASGMSDRLALEKSRLSNDSLSDSEENLRYQKEQIDIEVEKTARLSAQNKQSSEAGQTADEDTNNGSNDSDV